jgi:hypothetical protein
MCPSGISGPDRAAQGEAAARMPSADINGTTASCPAKDVLTEQEAKDLFKELKNQPQIPFDYPVDCCYTRAHEMCRIMESKGVECKKYWLFDKNFGDPLKVKDSLAPIKGGKPVEFPEPLSGKREPVKWVYHVAPIVNVKKADGSVSEMVMDPSIASGPVSKDEWRKIQGDPPGAYDEYSDSKAYFKNDKLKIREEDPEFKEADEQLKKHRKERDHCLEAEKQSLKK